MAVDGTTGDCQRHDFAKAPAFTGIIVVLRDTLPVPVERTRPNRCSTPLRFSSRFLLRKAGN
jgi:hypothetical protein